MAATMASGTSTIGMITIAKIKKAAAIRALFACSNMFFLLPSKSRSPKNYFIQYVVFFMVYHTFFSYWELLPFSFVSSFLPSLLLFFRAIFQLSPFDSQRNTVTVFSRFCIDMHYYVPYPTPTQ